MFQINKQQRQHQQQHQFSSTSKVVQCLMIYFCAFVGTIRHIKAHLYCTNAKANYFFSLCCCSILTANWILYEPIWKWCRFRFQFRTNINEPYSTQGFESSNHIAMQSVMHPHCVEHLPQVYDVPGVWRAGITARYSNKHVRDDCQLIQCYAIYSKT